MVTKESHYVLRVLHVPSGEYVEWAPGKAIEKYIIAELCDRVAAKGVGVMRSTEHVRADLKKAIEELFRDLKKQV